MTKNQLLALGLGALVGSNTVAGRPSPQAPNTSLTQMPRGFPTGFTASDIAAANYALTAAQQLGADDVIGNLSKSPTSEQPTTSSTKSTKPQLNPAEAISADEMIEQLGLDK